MFGGGVGRTVVEVVVVVRGVVVVVLVVVVVVVVVEVVVVGSSVVVVEVVVGSSVVVVVVVDLCLHSYDPAELMQSSLNAQMGNRHSLTSKGERYSFYFVHIMIEKDAFQNLCVNLTPTYTLGRLVTPLVTLHALH